MGANCWIQRRKFVYHRKCMDCETPGTVTEKGGLCAVCFATDHEANWATWLVCNGPGCLRERAACRARMEKEPKGNRTIEEDIARRDRKAHDSSEGDTPPRPGTGRRGGKQWMPPGEQAIPRRRRG